jgi:2-polyprenyl-3-methyl-5-hydroxy-6-metoxy-1,4-benzoquinol methylase
LFRPRVVYLGHLIARYLPQDRASRIVDLGCGHGTFLYFLSRAGYTRIAGIDTSQQQIDLAHRLGISQGNWATWRNFLRAAAKMDRSMLYCSWMSSST